MTDQAQTAVAIPPAKDVTGFADLVSVIERALKDPALDPARVEKFMELAERMHATEAKRLFNDAMSHCQSEMKAIRTNMTNDQTRSKYASFDALDRVMRPIYTNYGFSLSYDTEPSSTADEVIVLCYVAHSAGHERTYRAQMPAPIKGPKGNDVMTRTHGAGAAMTYGQRYLLKLIFNIAVERDDDGNAASTPITAKDRDALRELITKYAVKEDELLAFYKKDTIEDLTEKEARNAVEKINNKYAKKATVKA